MRHFLALLCDLNKKHMTSNNELGSCISQLVETFYQEIFYDFEKNN